jgi:hypothetical protein
MCVCGHACATKSCTCIVLLGLWALPIVIFFPEAVNWTCSCRHMKGLGGGGWCTYWLEVPQSYSWCVPSHHFKWEQKQVSVRALEASCPAGTAVTSLSASSAPNTVHSCSQHVFVAARLTSAWLGSVIPPAKAFGRQGENSYHYSLWTFWSG